MAIPQSIEGKVKKNNREQYDKIFLDTIAKCEFNLINWH